MGKEVILDTITNKDLINKDMALKMDHMMITMAIQVPEVVVDH